MQSAPAMEGLPYSDDASDVSTRLVQDLDAIRTKLHEHDGSQADCTYCRIASHVNYAFGEAVGEPIAPTPAEALLKSKE